jgi:hypothetical protein
MPAFRIAWQAQAGLDEASIWSAIVIAESDEEARQFIWARLRPEEMRSDQVDVLEVEELERGVVQIQKGNLWGEPWSVELQFDTRPDEEQMVILARRLARFEMTQRSHGEAVTTLRLSVPARDADAARARALTLVQDALGDAENAGVRAGHATPVWVWEQHVLDST